MSFSALQASRADTRKSDALALATDGFIGPVRLLSAAQSALIARHWQQIRGSVSLEWLKGLAASDRVFFDIATDPALLARLRPLLGDDIVLWGVSIIERDPGQIHPWHTDIESSGEGRFVSVWIGIENMSRAAALKVMSRSHTLGKTIQQVQHEHGRQRGEATDEAVLEWSRRLDPAATLVHPSMTDGEAVIYDGRLWHATDNRSDRRRTALLLQYAAANDAPTRVPDFSQAEWPFRYTSQRIPVIAASGRADPKCRVVLPPILCEGRERVTTIVQPFIVQPSSPSANGPSAPWQTFAFFHAPSVSFQAIESHASTLAPGHSPHPPHTHIEEELLIALQGDAEILIPEGPAPDNARIERLAPGDFVYHPAYQYHTIRNAGDRPISYLMFKWQAAPLVAAAPLASSVFRLGGIGARPEAEPFKTTLLFEHPTLFLSKLHAHVTDLQPGASYAPHVDDYDIAIVMLTGKVETLGRIVEPFGAIYYAAGEPHGMRNVGTEPARYLVFEFHAPADDRPKWRGPGWRRQKIRQTLARLRDPASAADLLRQLPHVANEMWGEYRPRTHVVANARALARTMRGLLRRGDQR